MTSQVKQAATQSKQVTYQVKQLTSQAKQAIVQAKHATIQAKKAITQAKKATTQVKLNTTLAKQATTQVKLLKFKRKSTIITKSIAGVGLVCPHFWILPSAIVCTLCLDAGTIKQHEADGNLLFEHKSEKY